MYMWNDLIIKLQASKLPRILRTNESHTSILSSYPTECYVIILTSAIVLSAVYLLFDINTETGFNSYCTQLYTDSCNVCVCVSIMAGYITFCHVLCGSGTVSAVVLLSAIYLMVLGKNVK